MRRHTIWFCCIAFVLLSWFEGPVTAEEVAIIAMHGSGQVAFISIENETVIKTVDINVPYPLFVETTPDAQTAVIACGRGHVCFIDIPTMEPVKTLELLWGPEQHGITIHPNEFEGMCITPDGFALITEVDEFGQLFIIDTVTMELAGPPRNVSGEPETIVVKGTDPSITFVTIDNDRLTVEETIEVGGPTQVAAFMQGGQTAVVTVPRLSRVKIIDVPGHRVKAPIDEDLGLAVTGVTVTTLETAGN